MKIKIENLGILKTAEFELGDFTIICGKNNTGKTYAFYAFYGFLRLWDQLIKIEPLSELCEKLLNTGTLRIELQVYINLINKFLEKANKNYSKDLYKVFASSEKLFEGSDFKLELNSPKINLKKKFKRTLESKKKEIIVFFKDENSSILEITSLQEKGEKPIPKQALEELINQVILELIFAPLFPKPFIASTERTGGAIFRKELDFFITNRFLELMGDKEKAFDPFKVIEKHIKSYPLPVLDNVEFVRNLENISKESSFLVKDHKDILDDFQVIIGGEYRIIHGVLYYIPFKSRVRLTMNESSSSIRSLLIILFYLKHIAQPGDILLVDEPELDLHPENQRRMARLFARLVNIGIKVFITTHSDYFVKELNTLIMLKFHKKSSIKVIKDYNYSENELLTPDQLKVYLAGKTLRKLPGKQKRCSVFSLDPCIIDPSLGIEVKGFDESINEMNHIQEEILFGGDE